MVITLVDISSKLEKKFEIDGLEVVSSGKKEMTIIIPHTLLITFAKYVKEILGFDHAISVSVIDLIEQNQFSVNYHLCSVEQSQLKGIILTIRVFIDRNTPRIPTLIHVYPSVEWHERESWEMFGVEFEGHPKLERLLLPESWDQGYPLRKDFRTSNE